jgi:hypothetical protein
VKVEALVWYPRNVEKLWEHGIGQDEVEDLVDQDSYMVDIHEDYPDQVRIIGRTGSGRLLTIALEDRAVGTIGRSPGGRPLSASGRCGHEANDCRDDPDDEHHCWQ